MKTTATRLPRSAQVFAVLVLLLVLPPCSAWAVQAHGGAEGLVSHQIGHVLFTIGMGYLLYRLHLVRQGGRGWGAFKAFLSLLILWNFLTFTGHWLHELVDAGKFVRQDLHVIAFEVTTFQDALYYLTRLDHLLLVPALLLLLLALREWRKQP